jgi:segregation and condensation protein B
VDASSGTDDALLCAALLAAGRQLNDREVAGLLNVGKEQVPAAIDSLREALVRADLGLVVEEVAGGYRLLVDPRLHSALSGLLAPVPLARLSTAALETLALVAYRQPVTRGELEAARGASCASTLETLQERELIKPVGHREVVGRPLLYGTTERFLIDFGLRALTDLPPLDDGERQPLLRR